MPCYDSRNDERQVLVTDEHRARLFKEWTHNSPVAELLCFVMHEMVPAERRAVLATSAPLRRWWRDHQARDAKKAKKKV